MPVGADHIEPAEWSAPGRSPGLRPGRSPEPDIGSAAGHVGRDRHRADRAGGGDDPGLGFVVARVQHLAGDPGRHQPRRQPFGFLDAHRADQDRPAGAMDPSDLVQDRVVLRFARDEHAVGMIDANHRPVGWNHRHPQPVGFLELRGGRSGGAGHPADPRIAADEMLQRDRAEDAAIGPPIEPLFRFERGLQAVGPVPILDHPAGVLVDDPDAAVAHQIVHVAPQQHAGVQRAVDLGQQRQVGFDVQAAAAEHPLDAARPRPRSARRRGRTRRGRSARPARSAATSREAICEDAAGRSADPAMTSGTRASSIRIESASSISAK